MNLGSWRIQLLPISHERKVRYCANCERQEFAGYGIFKQPSSKPCSNLLKARILSRTIVLGRRTYITMAVPTSVIIFVVISPGSIRQQFPWAGAREPLIGVAGLLLYLKYSSLYRFETIAACLPLALVTLKLPRFLKPAPTENDIGSEIEAAESLLTMR